MKYSLTPAETVAACIEICDEYRGALTLRQLYYQLVSRGLETNHAKVYARLTGIIAKARLSGAFPLDSLEDRGREVRAAAHTFGASVYGASDVVNAASMSVKRACEAWSTPDRWLGQPVHLSVFVEKDALSSVFQPVCERLGVCWAACKGYPSLSLVYSYALQVERFYSDWSERNLGSGKLQPVILYFGDHDPDGIQIPRSLLKQVRLVMDRMREEGRWNEAALMEPRLIRVALNPDQIEEHDPPPFAAKETSSRFARYVRETGYRDAWELDALPPDELERLIEGKVRAFWDEGVYEAHRRQGALVSSALKKTVAMWAGGDPAGLVEAASVIRVDSGLIMRPESFVLELGGGAPDDEDDCWEGEIFEVDDGDEEVEDDESP